MLKKQKALFAVLLMISACTGAEVEYKYPEKIKGKYRMPSAEVTAEKEDTVFNKKYMTFKIGDKTEKIEKSNETANLWPGVLPVLSQYPIEIAQEEFISTEWFSDPENSNRQLKVNVVKTKQDVKITVLCREKDKKNGWINQKNDPTLADKIKNDIVNQTINH